jgi:hypothetical protein
MRSSRPRRASARRIRLALARLAGGQTCEHPVLDRQKRARLCGEWATTTRTVEGAELHFCAEHAAAVDARRAEGQTQ